MFTLLVCFCKYNIIFSPYVANELLELIRIPEVPGSNLDPEIRYSD